MEGLADRVREIRDREEKKGDKKQRLEALKNELQGVVDDVEKQTDEVRASRAALEVFLNHDEVKRLFSETELAQHKMAINQLQTKVLQDSDSDLSTCISVNKNMLEYLGEILRTKKYEALKNSKP